MRECEAQMDALSGLIGINPESPLQSAVYGLMGEHTRRVADLIGCPDEWLEAWWLDHKFGDDPMHAGLVGEPMREITTLEQLLALICDDLESGK